MDLHLDLEVYSDREEDLQALFAELAAGDGYDDDREYDEWLDECDDSELPPVIRDEVSEETFGGWAA